MRRRDIALLALIAYGLLMVWLGVEVESKLLCASGFLALSSYCFLYLAWSE